MMGKAEWGRLLGRNTTEATDVVEEKAKSSKRKDKKMRKASGKAK